MKLFNFNKAPEETETQAGTGAGWELTTREIERALIAAGASRSFAKKTIANYQKSQLQNRLKTFRERLRGAEV